MILKLGMQHLVLKLYKDCINGDPRMTLTYFTTRSNFATWAFTWENVTLMDSLKFIASCDLEFG